MWHEKNDAVFCCNFIVLNISKFEESLIKKMQVYKWLALIGDVSKYAKKFLYVLGSFQKCHFYFRN